MRDLTSTANGLRRAFIRHHEWLVDDGTTTFYLVSDEIKLAILASQLHLEYLDNSGLNIHKICAAEFREETIALRLERTGDEVLELEFVPRVKALELKEGVEKARLKQVNDLAAKLLKQFPGSKIQKAALNEHNGRFAEIIIRIRFTDVAVLADVADEVTHEALLSKALVWLRSLRRRKKNRIEAVWIVANPKTANALRALRACLDESAAASVKIFRSPSAVRGDGESHEVAFEELDERGFNTLWSGRLPRLSLLRESNPTNFSETLLKLDPTSIDRVYSSKGETLRYRGLPFARTRIMSGEEMIWFGIESKKIPLIEETNGEFLELLEKLAEYRCHDSPNKQHEYYRTVPEAWLESLLRRNIKILDANLILSPIYNQFRAAREKIDLLALRSDGRLVIIELKVAPDRDMVFQAVDYWRKVESQRKRGVLNKARLFGNSEIADRPTIIYLAAPTLGFHNDLEYLGKQVSSRVEVYRFDLAENWRQDIRVLHRRRVGRMTDD